MLIHRFRGSKIPVARLQYVAAIIVGTYGFSDLEEAILDTSTKKMQEYVTGLGNEYIDYANAIAEYLATTDCLSYRGRLHNLYSLIGENKTQFKMSKESFAKMILRYVRDYSNTQLNILFLHTSACKKMLHVKIVQAFKNAHLENAGTVLSTAKINAIFNDFADYFSSYSSNIPYNSNGDNPFGWVVRSFEYFSMNLSNLANRVNERNQDAIIGDDKGSTMLELASIEATKEDVTIDFPDVIAKIAKASNLLYSHKNSKRGYYDIYSYYVSIRANELIEKINKDLGKDSQMINMRNGWYTIEPVASHVWNKFHARNTISKVMVSLVDVDAPVTELSKLYKRVLYTNESIPLNNDGAIKDGMRPFDSKNVRVRSRLSNGDRFEILYAGFSALREFVVYLEHRGIPIYSISPAIFRDLDITKRYRTLDEYIKLEPTVSRLYKEAQNSEAVVNGIYNNDKVYDMVSVNFSDTTVLYNYLKSSCKLCDIKKALQTVKDVEERKNFDKIAVNLYAKYLHEDDYVGLIISQSGSYIDRSFLPTRQKVDQFISSMNQNNSVKHKLLPIYPRNECYITAIDSNDLNDMTDVYRQAFIQSHNYDLNKPERYVITEGGLAGMNDKSLDNYYYWFIPFFGREIDNAKKNAKIDKNPLKYFTFLNVLEEKMKREGHPTMRNGYYNLHADTIEKEFSYLLEQENGATLLEVRVGCIKHCAAMLGVKGATEFELLHNLWVYSSIVQFLMKKTVKTLSDIAHTQRVLSNADSTLKAKYISEFNSWQYDGPFASLIRATAHYSYICMNSPISSISEFPFLGSVNLYGIRPTDVDDYGRYEVQTKATIIDAVNQYLEEHPDLFDFFKDLMNEINTQLRGSSTAHVKTTEYDNLLKQAANSLSTMIQTGDQNDDFAIRLRKHMTATTTTDSLGYVIAYNRRFMLNTQNGTKWFLHSFGYWVCIDGNNVSIKPVTQKDYTRYLKGNLDV